MEETFILKVNNKISPIIIKLYKKIEIITKEDKLTTINIIQVTTYLMQIIEKYQKLKGFERKEIILKVLIQYAKNNLSEEKYEEIKPFIDITIPIIIDTIISVDSKEIVIQNKKCLISCFPCINKNNIV
jgi:hypothetical protein